MTDENEDTTLGDLSRETAPLPEQPKAMAAGAAASASAEAEPEEEAPKRFVPAVKGIAPNASAEATKGTVVLERAEGGPRVTGVPVLRDGRYTTAAFPIDSRVFHVDVVTAQAALAYRGEGDKAAFVEVKEASSTKSKPRQ